MQPTKPRAREAAEGTQSNELHESGPGAWSTESGGQCRRTDTVQQKTHSDGLASKTVTRTERAARAPGIVWFDEGARE